MKDFRDRCTKIIGVGKSYDYNWPGLTEDSALPEPLIFVKPTSSLASDVMEIPRGCEVYHEVEIAVVIGKGGRDIGVANANEHVAGLALDMTAKNAQAAAAKVGYPWAISKGLDTFAAVGQFLGKDVLDDPHDVVLELRVNGDARQKGSTSGLIYTIPQLVSYISGIFTLFPGDVIMTGTPKGVGRVDVGQKIEAFAYDKAGKLLDSLSFPLVDRDTGFRFDGGYWLS